MKLIVGLGNPGEEHEKTRHNLGFMVVERFLKDFEPIKHTEWDNNEKFKSDVAHIDWQPKVGLLEKVILAKPKTYMNNSGLAVSLLASFYSPRFAGEAGKVKPEDIWILHDDIDLPIGSLRIRMGGSSAGHKGIESIIQHLKTERFWRFRLGIGHPLKTQNSKLKTQKYMAKHVEEFVLEPFATDEQGSIKHLVKHASKALGEALEHGIDSAMNIYNTK